VEAFNAERHLQIRSLDGRELPLQVDGDFVGAATEHTFDVAPGALTVIA
jgi:diacylglycerol kinase family enzyme